MPTVAPSLPLLTGAPAFPDHPTAAAERWLALAPTARIHPCTACGPDGATLASRSSWLGDADAATVLILLAGVHGVETAVGNAIQLDLLQAATTQAWRPPAGTAVLLVDCLCPWGFAWARRCDECGVDLNRNGLDFTGPLPRNGGYEQLRPIFALTDADQRRAALAEARAALGDRAFEEACSGGQYTDAAGPFFGGTAASHGHRLSRELIAAHDLAQRQVCVLDIHSGLGPYGYGELICDLSDAGLAHALARFGDAVTQPLAGTSSSVPKHGLMDLLWHRLLGPRSTYLTLEFGTFGTDALFAVLLDDHALWADGRPPDSARQRQAAAMRRHFVPDDPYWRSRVLQQGRLVIHQYLGDAPWN